MSDKVAKTAKRHPRPFPWRCSTCGKEEVRPATIAHTATVKHHGRQHKVEVSDLPVLRCGACSAILFENDSHERILRALRTQLDLLQPHEIRKERKERGLNQQELAQAVHAALATVCRWETGTNIQSRRADRALREFFARTPQRSSQLATSAAGSALGLSPEVVAKFRQLVESCVADTLQNVPPGSRDCFVDSLYQNRKVMGQLFTIVAGVRVITNESTLDRAVRHPSEENPSA